MTPRWAVAAVVVSTMASAACGGDDAAPEPPLSADAAQGKQLAISSGCASCHNLSGDKGAGPTWRELYGTAVTLDDGTMVIADEAYLRRSIMDPGAQKVEGYGAIMPRNRLSEQQVSLIISYIEAIGPAPST